MHYLGYGETKGEEKMVKSLKRLFIALLVTCISLGSIDFNVFANVIEENKEIKRATRCRRYMG